MVRSCAAQIICEPVLASNKHTDDVRNSQQGPCLQHTVTAPHRMTNICVRRPIIPLTLEALRGQNKEK